MSFLTSLKLDSCEDVQLPVHLTVRTKFAATADLTSLPEVISLFARVQAACAFAGLVILCSFAAQQGSWYQFQFQLPRLLAILLTASVTLQAYRRDWFTWRKGSTALRRLAAALQVIWLVSELAFLSAFTPILLVYLPVLSHPTSAAAFALRALPTATMVGLSGCLTFITGFRQRRRHHRMSSIQSGELNRLHAADMHTDAANTNSTTTVGYSTPPMSPADSCSSGSSGGMRSGLPSPTGHCYSPDRLAAHRKQQMDDGLGSSEVYLMQHSCSTEIDENDSMLFVHKVLTPIKTRIGEPAPVLANDYKPLLKTLMAQSGAKHNLTASLPSAYAQPAMEYAPVVATITIVKGKGVLNAPVPTIPVVQL